MACLGIELVLEYGTFPEAVRQLHEELYVIQLWGIVILLV